MINKQTRRRKRDDRKGGALIEFAIIVPVLTTLMLGVVDACRLYDASERTADALRQSARLAGMDRAAVIGQRQTINERMESDLRNLLTAAGLDGAGANIEIVDADDGTTPLNLSAPENSLKLFELKVEVPLDNSYFTRFYVDKNAITESIVFRNCRGVLVY